MDRDENLLDMDIPYCDDDHEVMKTGQQHFRDTSLVSCTWIYSSKNASKPIENMMKQPLAKLYWTKNIDSIAVISKVTDEKYWLSFCHVLSNSCSCRFNMDRDKHLLDMDLSEDRVTAFQKYKSCELYIDTVVEKALKLIENR
ncbi:hypothetical protein CEXT_15791 [Caerostris extrusa]|uniref:Uncharacterized protein n=1 Tax=Caerostris extrusa TaxID=172846 RepID=A0AAV4RFR7_CAEEX|nr:hypothetical protein CEXT_15791 [Caerostris extrusa]